MNRSHAPVFLGGLQFDLSYPAGFTVGIGPDYRKFLPPFSNPLFPTSTVSVECVPGKIDEAWLKIWRSQKPIIDNESTWAMAEIESDADWKYIFGPPIRGKKIPAVFFSLVSHDFSRIRVYLEVPEGQTEVNIGKFYPLDDTLCRHIAAFHDGVIVHASGVRLGEKGYLFLGDSGAGKSTIAELFENALGKDVIFSDDRILVRRHAGKWWMFGTPWHGTFPRLIGDGIELGGLSFIEKTPDHEIEVLTDAGKIPRLLKVFLAIWWLKKLAVKQLKLFDQMIQDPELPFFRLGFKPDISVVDHFVRAIESYHSRQTGDRSFRQQSL